MAGLTGSSSVSKLGCGGTFCLISLLVLQTYPTTNTSANTSLATSAYLAELNTHAIVRDYAIQFLNNLTITTIDSVKLQAAALAELTNVPTELTRQAVVRPVLFDNHEYIPDGYSLLDVWCTEM